MGWEWVLLLPWAWVIYIMDWGIRVVMLVVVPQRRNPAAAKGWLLLIFFFPWAGLLLFILFGRASLPLRRSKQREKLLKEWMARSDRFAAFPNIFYPEVSPEQRPAVQLACNLGRLPILGGNSVELLADYEGSLARLIADIDAAQDHVHLLYYIFEDDHSGAAVAEALIRAAQRNVRCRLLVDAIGSRGAIRRLLPRLRQADVKAHAMLPVGLFKRLARFDVRNHRKIAVIDGRIGYTGSQNIINAFVAEGLTNEEMVVRVSGPVVWELQAVFNDDWYLTTRQPLPFPTHFPTEAATGSVAAQVLPSGPGYPTANNQRLFVSLLHAAREKVVLTTPYFIPDEAFLQAMETAAIRGVDVNLIVSSKVDHRLVGLAQRSYYEELLEAGVKIHAYRKRFLHAKHITIDHDITVIGSSNLDIRSFALNNEISLIIYDASVTRRLQEEQARYLTHCETITLARWKKRILPRRAAENIARLFSPLL